MSESVGNRFGEIVVREGYASRNAVQECLSIQEKLRSFGVEPKKLGEIMVEKGFLKDSDVDQILEIQTNIQSGATQGIESRPSLRRSSEKHGAEVEFDPPKQLAGYEILNLLGAGGMGAVYKARQTSLDRIVAIKILPPRTAKNRSFIERFISEARTVARLNHKNIIAGIDVGEDKGFYYFVMEYVEGESLSEIIERDGPLPEAEALNVMVQMARALDHANKHNLVHRDVKPQNILIDQQNQAKLCDLGLAQSQGEFNASGSGETRGTALGTPHYLSPEQARGESDLDIRSDLYSLGASFFHMLTGRPPFEGQSPMVLMTKHLTEEPTPPRKIDGRISRPSSDLVMALMEKDKEDRPQNPTELLEDLQRIQQGKKPKVGTKGSRRQRKAERVSNKSTGRGRRRRTDSSGAADDNRRRRRAATIRSVKNTENTFMIIFIVTIVLLVGVFLFMVAVKEPSVKLPPKATQAQEEIARDLYSAARRYEYENRSDVSGIKSKYREIVEKYPGTSVADLAATRLRSLR